MRRILLAFGSTCLLAISVPNLAGAVQDETTAVAPALLPLTPLEIAKYVKTLLNSGKIEDARRWYWRGLIRAAVEESYQRPYLLTRDGIPEFCGM